MTMEVERLRVRARWGVARRSERSAASDGRDDRDFVAGLQVGLEAVEEADVLAVHVQVDEAAQGTLVVAQALADLGEERLKLVQRLVNARAADVHLGLTGGDRAEG